MKGSQGIPALHLTTLNKLIQKFDRAPNMFFSNLFATPNYPSDSIEWEIEYSTGGMTPFVAPGSVAPSVGIDGISRANARAAYWKEKMYFDEVFLNNLRLPGTSATYQTAARQLAKGARKLRYRCDRRREWMNARALLDGSLTYIMQGGTKISVSYGIPETHKITLDSTRYWKTGANKNPIEDIFDAKTMLLEDAGVIPNYAVINSQLLKVLMLDEDFVQKLLSKSAFGNGDLFARPAQVIGTLLGVGQLMIYDEIFEVQGWITAISDNVVTLDDVSDFEVGGKARVQNMQKHNSWIDYAITDVDKSASTITVDSNLDAQFKPGRDKVIMKKKFIGDHEFFLFSDTAEGEKIAEFMQAPYGNDRRWGFYADTKDEWDPEGLWFRVQDKGLPVIYHPDSSITLTVGVAGEGASSS